MKETFYILFPHEVKELARAASLSSDLTGGREFWITDINYKEPEFIEAIKASVIIDESYPMIISKESELSKFYIN
jgi:hypothetical protein